MSRFWQDIRFALRALRRSPGFTAAAVLSLGLGIGANTAIYTVYRAALLKPLPVHEPGEIVKLSTDRGTESNANFTWLHYQALRDADVFGGMLAHTALPVAVRFGNLTEQYEGAAVTPDFFQVLGVQPQAGRVFNPVSDVREDAQVVVIGEALRRRLFGERTDVLGEVIQLNRQPFTIIGVAPADFTGLIRGSRHAFWVPIANYPLITGDNYFDRPSVSWLDVMARLKPAATLESAQAQLRVLDARMREREFLGEKHRNVIAAGGRGLSWTVLELEQPLEYLMAAVALVLLIACANIANLLLARAAGRRKDLAIRVAIGGSRARLLSQLLAESFTLALLAGGVGLLIASWLTDALTSYQPSLGIELILDTRPDTGVLLFTLAVSVVTGMLFGLAPAIQATRTDLMTLLRNAVTPSFVRSGGRSALVVIQVALSLVLLIGASLLVRTLSGLNRIELGFTNRNALIGSIDLLAGNYDAERGRVFLDRLLQRVRTLPGVIDASAATVVNPAPWGSNYSGVFPEGYTPAREEVVGFDVNTVDDRYFATLGLPIVQGRAFAPSDRSNTAQVAVINEEMARRYWPGQNPIGKRIYLDEERTQVWEVIGVARGSKYRGLREERTTNVWRPLSQSYRTTVTLIVHTRGDPLRITETIRGEIRSMDPAVPLFGVRTLEQHIALATSQERMAARLASAFSVVALLLAAIGLYGLLATFVNQRTKEIGVRMALGAHRGSVLGHVLAHGLRLVVAGVLIGIPAALGIGRLLAGVLYGISATDTPSFVVAVALLLTAATVATLLPARRAVTVDPMIALRAE
jgi:predicted permease